MHKQAKKWREENESYQGGVVVFYDNEIQGWVNCLRDPETWRPGCIAVDELGNEFVATGGNDQNGAKCWQKNVKAA